MRSIRKRAKMPSFIDLTGQQFGQLTVIRRVDNSAAGFVRYETRCTCGKVSIVHRGALRSGHTVRCRDCGYKIVRGKKSTHGMSRHPARAVWNTMRQRCQNPLNTSYAYYGARGIFVDPSWHDFAAFWRDMGPSYVVGLTLDRRDNSGPYSKENCHWVTRTRQMRNTRQNHVVATPWGVLPLCEAAEKSGLSRTTLASRIRRGWSADRWLAKVS
jgi:hypothetical protein